MAHGGSTADFAGILDPAVVGVVLTRVGLGALAVTLPVAAGALAGLLATADSPAVGVALRAMSGPLLGGFGLSWLFHVAALGALCGCWLLGAGLVLSGLFD